MRSYCKHLLFTGDPQTAITQPDSHIDVTSVNVLHVNRHVTKSYPTVNIHVQYDATLLSKSDLRTMYVGVILAYIGVYIIKSDQIITKYENLSLCKVNIQRIGHLAISSYKSKAFNLI